MSGTCARRGRRLPAGRAGRLPVVVDDQGAFAGVVEMAHLNKGIRRAQYEARLHYEEMEANG